MESGSSMKHRKKTNKQDNSGFNTTARDYSCKHLSSGEKPGQVFKGSDPQSPQGPWILYFNIQPPLGHGPHLQSPRSLGIGQAAEWK